jgi:hypothetical protein
MFQGMHDINNPSFARNIVETVVKVCFYVVMMDLECDELILEILMKFS